MTAKRKWQWKLGALAAMSMILVVGWDAISPAHWLKKVNFGQVKIDDRPVPATIYFGDPRSSEAESIVLVQIAGGNSYFLDFGWEKVRQASPSEYVSVFEGVWCFKSMEDGPFHDPLPSNQLNEFRIATSDGHVVSVQF